MRANVAFYPIDARGLVAMAPAGDATQASPKGTGVFTGSTQTTNRTSFHDTQDTIYTLAADTGGKALLDSNDLTLGIKAVQTDISSYYVLGYYSAEPRAGRQISPRQRCKIASLGRIGQDRLSARLLCRQSMGQNEFERQGAAARRRTHAGRSVHRSAARPGSRLFPDWIATNISFRSPSASPAPSLDLSPKSTTDLDFIGQIRDPRGKLLGGVRDEIKLKLTEENAAQLAPAATSNTTPASRCRQATTILRFLARENQNGKMGTFEMKFTVPDLSKQSSAVRMSSVVWSNQREPLFG